METIDITEKTPFQMPEANNIEIQKIETSRIEEIDFTNIPFGKMFTDHMFVTDYSDGEWKDIKIIPYGKMQLSPSISALHYGQSIFEGMKAYKNKNNEIYLFRPFENAKRFNRSAIRMCMPEIPEEIFMNGITTLLKLDAAWVPSAEGCSLYIRPFMFATTEQIKVHSSDKYKFVILACPVGPYYREPLRLKIETEHIRACEGGVGFVKAAGNYGAALRPAKNAQEQGYHQLIWTDAKEHKYIEEAGVMNILFVLGDKLVTPSLESKTILPGITRDSVLTLAKDWGIEVEERKISITEIIDALNAGTLNEAFGVGTAATIAHIAIIGYDGKDYELPARDTDELLSNRLVKELQGIRRGDLKDPHNWAYRVL